MKRSDYFADFASCTVAPQDIDELKQVVKRLGLVHVKYEVDRFGYQVTMSGEDAFAVKLHYFGSVSLWNTK